MKRLSIILWVGVLVGLTSCEVDEVLNPNSPTVESFEDGATLADLQLLGTGLQAVIREDMQFHFWTTSIIGREYFDLRGTDPRYTSELLGQNGGDLDNAGFLTTRTYFGRYRSIRNANLLKTALANTSATLTADETNATLGYANTIIGYELLLEANRQYENGLRIDVADVNNLGPFLNGYQATLAAIRVILDEGFNQLDGTSTDMIFALQGFSSIPGAESEAVAKWNRALAARCAIYQNDKAGARALLGGSFMDMMDDMNVGAFYSFGGATGNDLPNLLFNVPGVDNYLAHKSFKADSTAGDSRLSKVTNNGLEITLDGLCGDHLVTLYGSSSSEASMIRNEELILIYAEAQIGADNIEAVRAINIVRNAAGIGDYTGATDEASLVDELLYQRRYSLFGEGHRWIDMRRYNRLDQLPLDRAGDKIHVQFPRPASEG